MRNLFRLCHLNRFHILSEHHPFIFNHIYCTFSIKFLPCIFRYLKMSEILVIFLSLLIFLVLGKDSTSPNINSQEHFDKSSFIT